MDKLLNKQSQLNKIIANRTKNRTDKNIQLSRKQRVTGKDVRKKDNIEDGEQVMAKEKTESTVVKDGNTIKSKIGYDVCAEANNLIPENFDAVDVGENVVVVANNVNENVKKKRKTAKEVRQAKPNPKVRTTARSHQNFRDRYLTIKKQVDVLQPDHGVEQDFLFAVNNNLQDPNVRGADSTAGKWMVYGRGELMEKFLGGGIK